MIVAFDPVAMELMIDPGNGLPPLTIRTAGLQTKLYTDLGVLSCLVGERSVEVVFLPLIGEPGRLESLQLAPNCWLLRFEDQPPISGGPASS